MPCSTGKYSQGNRAPNVPIMYKQELPSVKNMLLTYSYENKNEKRIVYFTYLYNIFITYLDYKREEFIKIHVRGIFRHGPYTFDCKSSQVHQYINSYMKIGGF